jgi:hypothetical protein
MTRHRRFGDDGSETSSSANSADGSRQDVARPTAEAPFTDWESTISVTG